MLVNNEDDEGELQRRLAAICTEHGIDRAALQGRLHLHCPADEAPFLALARDPQTRQLRRTKALRELSDYMGASGASVFIVDPFVETHEGDENSNSDVGAAMKQFRAVARLRSAAGLIIHHTRKPPHTGNDGLAGDAAVARGASAFQGNVRVLATLFGMTPNEAAQYGIVGAGVLRYSKGKPAHEDACGWHSAFILGYLGETGDGTVEPEHKLCLTVDAYAGVAHPAPGDAVRRFNNMLAACASISERWSNIPPPANAVL